MLIKSIRTAIMLLSLVFMLVIAATVFVLAVQEHRSLYADNVEGNLDALSDNMASDLVSIVSRSDYFFELKALLLSLDPYDHVLGAAVYDDSWNLVEEYVGMARQLGSQKTVPGFSQWPLQSMGMHHHEGLLIAVKRVGDPEAPLGYLVIVNDFQGPLDDSTESLLSRTFPAAALSILLLMLMFSVFGHRWLSPLTRLSQFARRIQISKNYATQLPQEGHYEVASLTRDISNMMAAIRQESEINQEYVELLEQRREEMEYLANYDNLTSLVNRQYFIRALESQLQESEEDGSHFSVMFVDLDGFKVVNDSLGHEVGDLLLIEVARRLKSYVREDDLVSRHGGDEFLILVQECDDKESLAGLAERIVAGLTQKFTINSWEVRIGASIGISTTEDSRYDPTQLIRNADVAMYQAKSAGKAQYCFFNQDMMAQHRRRLDLANAIDIALSNDEFSLVYQPKVTAQGRPVGAEALIRWHSNKLGFVSPAEFIPIAEQAGKISEITQWVINRVCKDIRDHIQPYGIELPIAINLSAMDLKKYHMLGVIKGAFLKYDIQPGMIEFEVTEHSYLGNLDLAKRFFSEISAMGCKVALDDFGTGYSSLSYLTKIPIDLIKIDKQFVDNIGLSQRDDALVLTIIEMAKRLGVELCAEGVESREQLLFLNGYGCQVMQGYYFAKPCPLDDFIAYMDLYQRQAKLKQRLKES